MKGTLSLSLLLLSLVVLPSTSFGQVDDRFELFFELDEVACDGEIVAPAGSTVEVTVNVKLTTTEAGTSGATVPVGATGADGAELFGCQIAETACAASLILGDAAVGNEILNYIVETIDPDKVPTGGTEPQGPGYILGLVTSPFAPPGGFTLPAGTFTLGQFTASVVVPEEAAGKVVTIEIKNGIQGAGTPKNAVITFQSASRTPVTTPCSFTVKPEGGAEECAEADWGLYFGPAATGDAYTITGDSFPISMRNATESFGFSLGVQIEGSTYTMVDDVVGTENDTIQLIISDDQVMPQVPATNTATGPTVEENTVNDIALGSATSGLTAGELVFNVEPTVGGPGFTAGFLADAGGSQETIPATGTDVSCPVNEVLVVSFGDIQPTVNFARGDANGDDRLNITDGILLAQNIFLAAERPNLVIFDCQDMLDSNDDGSLGPADVIMLLQWIFLNGNDLAMPFMACDVDPTDDDPLGCAESNCQ